MNNYLAPYARKKCWKCGKNGFTYDDYRGNKQVFCYDHKPMGWKRAYKRKVIE